MSQTQLEFSTSLLKGLLSLSPSRLHVSEDSSSLSVILHVSLAFSLGQGREGHFVFLLFCCRGTQYFEDVFSANQPLYINNSRLAHLLGPVFSVGLTRLCISSFRWPLSGLGTAFPCLPARVYILFISFCFHHFLFSCLSPLLCVL